MPRIVLYHWDGREAAERCARLSHEDIEASVCPRERPQFRGIRENPPDAVVIDLTRMPSYGRAVAVMMREQKSLRSIPIIFIEGDPDKTALARQQVPDSVFTTWPRISEALERVARRGPRQAPPPRPPARTPAQILRIREGTVVALLHAPAGAEKKLNPLPAGVRMQTRLGGADVALAFVRSAAEAGRALSTLEPHIRAGRTFWLLWPKKSSGTASGLSMPMLREMAIALGLIDNKVCAFDETWSAIAIARRRAAR